MRFQHIRRYGKVYLEMLTRVKYVIKDENIMALTNF